MIRINVAQQLTQPVGVTRLYKVSETDKASGYKIEGELNLVRTDKGILIIGELDTTQRLTCSRCLEIFEYPLTLSLSEEFVPTMDIISGTPVPVPEGLFTIDSSHEICVDDALNQYKLMALPMKPLCKSDCRGLCDHCGMNLNNGDCTCSHDVDPRWAVLAGLASTVKREV
ncbi:DUF177 domain-containing protein [Chloroflexota bacterium]